MGQIRHGEKGPGPHVLVLGSALGGRPLRCRPGPILKSDAQASRRGRRLADRRAQSATESVQSNRDKL